MLRWDFQIKAKEITGEDIDIAVADINTDVNVEVNLNDLARTEGIVSLKNIHAARFPSHFLRILVCFQL